MFLLEIQPPRYEMPKLNREALGKCSSPQPQFKSNIARSNCRPSRPQYQTGKCRGCLERESSGSRHPARPASKANHLAEPIFLIHKIVSFKSPSFEAVCYTITDNWDKEDELIFQKGLRRTDFNHLMVRGWVHQRTPSWAGKPRITQRNSLSEMLQGAAATQRRWRCPQRNIMIKRWQFSLVLSSILIKIIKCLYCHAE